MARTWSADDVAELKRLYIEQKRSHGEIATAMGRERGSVSSKLKRLGLESPDPKGQRARAPVKAASSRDAGAAEAPSTPDAGQRRPPDAGMMGLIARLDAEPTPSDAVAIEDVGPGQCLWVYGTSEMRCCGRPATPGLSWCEPHARRVLRPAPGAVTPPPQPAVASAPAEVAAELVDA